MKGHYLKVAVYKAGINPSPRIKSVHTLILDFPDSRLYKDMSYLRHPACGVLLYSSLSS